MPRTTSASARIDVKTLDPDFLIFPTYKWVLGPYGRAFMYVAKRHQDGVPLEQTAFGGASGHGRGHRSISRDTRYRRRTRGATTWASATISSRMEMAAIGMEMMAGWGNEPIVGAACRC